MIVKKHSSQGRLVIAVCDNSLVGKKFEEGDLILDLSSDFYKGEEMGEEELKELVKKANTINVVGEESVGFFIKEGIVSENEVKEISGIKYSLIFC
jgi:hypothetical protein